MAIAPRGECSWKWTSQRSRLAYLRGNSLRLELPFNISAVVQARVYAAGPRTEAKRVTVCNTPPWQALLSRARVLLTQQRLSRGSVLIA